MLSPSGGRTHDRGQLSSFFLKNLNARGESPRCTSLAHGAHSWINSLNGFTHCGTWGQESKERRLQGARHLGLRELHVELPAARVEGEEGISVDGGEEDEAFVAHLQPEHLAAVERRRLRLVRGRRLKLLGLLYHNMSNKKNAQGCVSSTRQLQPR